MWRKIIIPPLIFIFLSFLVLDSFLWKTQGDLKEEARALNPTSINYEQELSSLKTEANNFNQKLERIRKVASEENQWSGLISDIKTIAGENISLGRIFADSSNDNVLLSGSAASADEAIAFKNRLDAHQGFVNVNLPLSNIKNQGTLINFSNLTFQVQAQETE